MLTYARKIRMGSYLDANISFLEILSNDRSRDGSSSIFLFLGLLAFRSVNFSEVNLAELLLPLFVIFKLRALNLSLFRHVLLAKCGWVQG